MGSNQNGKTNFRGSFTALVTPFRDDGIDEKAFRDLVEWQIGVQGIDDPVPVGPDGAQPVLLVAVGVGVADDVAQHAPEALRVDALVGGHAERVALAAAAGREVPEVRHLLGVQPGGRELEQRYGATYLTLHRGDLHEALASIVPGDCVHLGKKLVAINARAARTELSFADGSEVEAEAVIGADGVHSLIRDAVAGPEQPRFIGRLAYRTTFPAALLSGVEVGSSPQRSI